MKVTFEEGGAGGARPLPSHRAVPRDVKRAMWRGFRGLCPECGAGAIFDGYLTVRPSCRGCGEEFHHHRADDLPPYLTILVVGHVIVSGLLFTERAFAPSMIVQWAIWIPATLLLSLALIRPIKGAVVALQWALGMHGFGKPRPPLDLLRKAS